MQPYLRLCAFVLTIVLTPRPTTSFISRPSDIYKSPPPLDNSPALRRGIVIADTMNKYASTPMILKEPAAVSVGFVFAVWLACFGVVLM